MRVADRTISTNYLTSINNTKERVQTLSLQLATGSKINAPSDDPTALSRSLKLYEKISTNATYKENVETSLSFLKSTTSALESVTEEIEDIEISFANLQNPLGSSSYNTIAQQIDQALDSMLSTVNSEFEGKYLFSGTDYSGAPYGYNAAGTAIVSKLNDVSGEQVVRISSSFVQKINVTGDELFGTLPSETDVITGTETDIFNTLIRVSNGLKAGNAPSSADVEIVKDFRKHLLDQSTDAGETINRLESTSQLLDSQTLELQDLVDSIRGVNETEAITELQSEQYYLELSYKMASMILPQSLLDYL